MRATDATPKKDEPKWVPVFLKHFAECGIVTAAAKKARINRQSVYVYRDRHPEFAALWKSAEAEAVELAEAELFRRAVVGELKPVFHAGEKVGTIREKSDTLLIFLLKARRPNVYRDNKRIELAGDPNAPMKHEHRFSLTPEDIAAAEALEAAADRGVHSDG